MKTCARCGRPFGMQMQVEDVKKALNGVGYNFWLPAGGPPLAGLLRALQARDPRRGLRRPGRARLGEPGRASDVQQSHRPSHLARARIGGSQDADVRRPAARSLLDSWRTRQVQHMPTLHQDRGNRMTDVKNRPRMTPTGTDLRVRGHRLVEHRRTRCAWCPRTAPSAACSAA